MTIPRIIINRTLQDGCLVEIKDESYHYLVRINRLKTGDKFYLLDDNQNDFLGEVVNIGKKSLTAYVFLIKKMLKPDYKIEAIFSLLKGDKNEFIIKAGTQMGLTDFTPVITKRTIVKLDKAKSVEKLKRLRSIAEDTARTSFLSFIPTVTEIKSLTELSTDNNTLKLIFSEQKALPLLKTFEKEIYDTEEISCFFGPEGGIEDDEYDFLIKKGFRPVSLGERALKAEFAFIFALSVITYIKRGSF